MNIVFLGVKIRNFEIFYEFSEPLKKYFIAPPLLTRVNISWEFCALPTNLLTNKADLPSFPDISSWLQGSYPFHADILATSHQKQNMAHLKT